MNPDLYGMRGRRFGEACREPGKPASPGVRVT